MGKGSLSVIAGGIDGDTLQPGLGQTEPARGQSGEISGAEIGKSYRAGDVGSDVCRFWTVTGLAKSPRLKPQGIGPTSLIALINAAFFCPTDLISQGYGRGCVPWKGCEESHHDMKNTSFP